MVEAHKKKSTKKDAEDLPMLEEINELIEKERLLMQLKVLEQQRMAEEWKEKYESLVGTAAMGKVGNKALAIVGSENDPHNDSNSLSQKKREVAPPATSEGVQKMLVEMEHSWVLDLSGVAVDSKLINQINTDVFSARATGTNSITVCNFSKCSLDEDSMTAVTTLAGKAAVLALDLHGNSLGPLTLQNLVVSVKSRRKSPQYLLLNANLPMMGASISTLLNALTDSTWGVHVSLQDVSYGALSEHSVGKKAATVPGKPNAAVKAGKPPAFSKDAIAALTHTKEALSAGLYSNTSQPHKSLEAIKCLCDILNPVEILGKGNKGKKAPPPTGIIRTSKITTLAVLGLTHAQLTIESVNQLGKLLELAAPSLTDLDLSFAYVGHNGAKMLRAALDSSGCQLIRLAAPGNSFGDSGITALSQGLRNNNTLTYLDVRSNQITAPGLRALCSALTAAKPLLIDREDTFVSSRKSHKLANTILQCIDVGGNFLSQADVLGAEKGLRDWGIEARLTCLPAFPGYSAAAATRAAGATTSTFKTALSVPVPEGSYILYQQPRKIAVSMGLTDNFKPGARIYSIDLRFANTHYAHHSDHPLCIEWSMRPQSERTATARDARSGTGGSELNQPWLSEPTRLRWELHLETASANHILQRGELSASSCLFNQQGEDATWARCQATATHVPAKGELHIYIYSCDGTHCPPAVEACDLCMFSIPPSPYRVVGGDCSAWSGPINACISVGSNAIQKAWLEWNRQLESCKGETRGYVPLRAVQWLLPTTSLTESNIENSQGQARLSWYSKLCPAAGINRQDATLGYAYIVLHAPGLTGAAKVIARGTCQNSATGASTLDAVLEAWSWKEISVDISDCICPGDVLLVAAKPQSPYEGSVIAMGSGDDAASCTVHMKNFQVWAGVESGMSSGNATHMHLTEHTDSSVECALGVFALYNPPLEINI